MKRMKCLDCKEMFSAKTPEEMLKNMMPHYMAEHKTMMTKGTQEAKDAWMKKFHKKWDASKEI